MDNRFLRLMFVLVAVFILLFSIVATIGCTGSGDDDDGDSGCGCDCDCGDGCGDDGDETTNEDNVGT